MARRAGKRVWRFLFRVPQQHARIAQVVDFRGRLRSDIAKLELPNVRGQVGIAIGRQLPIGLFAFFAPCLLGWEPSNSPDRCSQDSALASQKTKGPQCGPFHLAWPAGLANDAAEVTRLETRLLVGYYICLDVAECRLRLVADAVVERLDNRFFEVIATRMCKNDGVPVVSAEFLMVQPENIRLYTSGDQCNERVHMFRNAWRGMKGNGSPHALYVALVDAVTFQEITRSIRSIDLETAAIAAVLVG